MALSNQDEQRIREIAKEEISAALCTCVKIGAGDVDRECPIHGDKRGAE